MVIPLENEPNWAVAHNFRRGKRPDQTLCEDTIVDGPYYAVIDGATDKSGHLYLWDGESVSAGKFASLTLAEALGHLPLGNEPAIAVAYLSEKLNEAVLSQYPNIKNEDRPSATLAVFDPLLEAVWSVGDCQYGFKTTNGRVTTYTYPLEVDRLLQTMRALVHKNLKAEGRPWAMDSDEPDPGREIILPFLKVQGLLANTDGDFGYGIINGLPVPRKHIYIKPIPHDCDTVYLASDGYPQLIVDNDISFDQAEKQLQYLLNIDPLCIGPLAGNKGLVRGNLSHDDRAWLELRHSN
jgi:glycerophosphoryl diester phosphodiesterase